MIPQFSPTGYQAQREKLGLTQAELATRLGVSRATINRRETGQNPIHPEASYALAYLAQQKKERLLK